MDSWLLGVSFKVLAGRLGYLAVIWILGSCIQKTNPTEEDRE